MTYVLSKEMSRKRNGKKNFKEKSGLVKPVKSYLPHHNSVSTKLTLTFLRFRNFNGKLGNNCFRSNKQQALDTDPK